MKLQHQRTAVCMGIALAFGGVPAWVAAQAQDVGVNAAIRNSVQTRAGTSGPLRPAQLRGQVRLGDQFDPVTETVSEGIIPSAGLSGYSKHVLSAQAYYEIGPVSLQAIYNYRSKYFQDFVGGNSQLRYVGPSETVDFRASLALMKGVSLRFEAFDPPTRIHSPRRPLTCVVMPAVATLRSEGGPLKRCCVGERSSVTTSPLTRGVA